MLVPKLCLHQPDKGNRANDSSLVFCVLCCTIASHFCCLSRHHSFIGACSNVLIQPIVVAVFDFFNQHCISIAWRLIMRLGLESLG